MFALEVARANILYLLLLVFKNKCNLKNNIKK
jgi:hypothetical protein